MPRITGHVNINGVKHAFEVFVENERNLSSAVGKWVKDNGFNVVVGSVSIASAIKHWNDPQGRPQQQKIV